MTARPTAVRTFEEVAAELGISKARVMQLESSALRKLRRRMIEIEPALRDEIAGAMSEAGNRSRERKRRTHE